MSDYYTSHRKNIGEGYENLANAIVIQAVNDFRKARKFYLKHCKEYPHDRVMAIVQAEDERFVYEKAAYKLEHGSAKGYRFIPTPEERMVGLMFNAESTIEEVVRFIKSGWYGELTNLDPDVLLKKLQSETYEKPEKKKTGKRGRPSKSAAELATGNDDEGDTDATDDPSDDDTEDPNAIDPEEIDFFSEDTDDDENTAEGESADGQKEPETKRIL